jgi:prevent-host-death family protein
MRRVNIRHAKTHLCRLVEQAARGESFIIAKAGKPLVKVVPPSEADDPVRKRLGFLSPVNWKVPDDFDAMDRAAIQRLFEEGDPG